MMLFFFYELDSIWSLVISVEPSLTFHNNLYWFFLIVKIPFVEAANPFVIKKIKLKKMKNDEEASSFVVKMTRVKLVFPF